MSRTSIALALLAAACAPRATAPRAGTSARATTVVVPPPSSADAAPRATAQATDAGPPPAGDAASQVELIGDGGGKSIELALSMRAAGRFTVKDGGVSFVGSIDASVSPKALSPDLVVRSALLVPSKNGHRLMLYDRAVTCTHRLRTGARHVDVSIDWKRSANNRFANVSVTNGHVEHYEGRIDVLAAPSAPGSVGRIRVTRTHGGNVLGGVVQVHVCK